MSDDPLFGDGDEFGCGAGDSGDDEVECDEAIAWAWTFLDGECTDETRARLCKHLGRCAGCLGHYALEGRMKQLIATKCGGDKAPKRLRRPRQRGGVQAMRNRTMAVLWHDIADPTELYLGPDKFDTQTVVTAACGEISGELDRLVSRDLDGGRVVRYATRIDGLGDGAGVAKVESDSADELMCLAMVAGLLSRELAKLVGRDQAAGPASYRVPAIDGGHLAVQSTAQGYRFVVEKSAADQTSVTITEASAAQLVEAIRKALADR